jgi:hypothetical protein
MKINFRLLFVFLAVATLQVVILAALGRIPWCICHGFELWKGEAWSSHTSQHLFDPYSFSHVQHGLLFFLVLWLLKVAPARGIWIALFVELGWEVLENTSLIIDRYRAATASLDYFGDSIGNSVGDLISCLAGFLVAARYSWKWSLALYIGIEIVMLLAIRDCLTLNVLMLLYPIEPIKQWQVRP